MMTTRRFRRPYAKRNDLERCRIVGMCEAGQSYRAIGSYLQSRDTASSLPPMGTSHHFTALGCDGLTEAFKTSAFCRTTSAKSFGVALQPFIMVTIGLTSHRVQR
ncbi:hypothetical protein TNCV_955441 [Trichonephila clavipes]|nr:hypothetical protein TNCV_955441 [Trichonephila clavipes]